MNEMKQCLIYRTSEASDGAMKGVDSEGDAEAAFGVGGLAKDFCGVLKLLRPKKSIAVTFSLFQHALQLG